MEKEGKSSQTPPASPGRKRRPTGNSNPAATTTEDSAAPVPRADANKTLFENAEIVFRSSSLALLKSKGKLLAQKVNNFVDRADDGYLKGVQKVVGFMNQMYKQGKICDVMIRAKDKVLYAHKLALGAYSPSLTSKFSEYAPGEMVSVDISEYSVSITEQILNFIYTTDIDINDDNIIEIYGCSVELGIDVLVALCIEYIRNINVKNCFKFLPIAEKFRLKDIVQQIYDFVCQNFMGVAQTAGFLALSSDKLLTIVSQDDVKVGSELDVFLALVGWLDQDPERLPLAPTLMSCVRFRLIKPEDLATRVEPVKRVFDNRLCFEMLYDAMKFHALRYSSSPSGQTMSLPSSRAFSSS